MENKLSPIKTKQALSIQLEPQSWQMRNWIKDEIGMLAILFGQPMTAERLTLYAQELQSFKQYQLRVAFIRLRRERKSSDFGFPLPGDIIERMTEVSENLRIEEWKGPTDAEIQERERQQPETAGWWKSLKQQIATIGLKKRDEKPPIVHRETELSDGELEARRQLLKRQAEEMKARFDGTK
jgi:hypothetical protein